MITVVPVSSDTYVGILKMSKIARISFSSVIGHVVFSAIFSPHHAIPLLFLF